MVAAQGCGTGPSLSGTRESGQTGLMDETFAGKNKCDPDNHERPFVVEWDATDLSSFEARASKDVVFVEYEGCKLRILEGCRPGVNGGYGSYRAIDWTSGALESIDIKTKGDLYAKLPLGAKSLGGRVESGEQFKMEYYVAGTTSATREDVTRAELVETPACKNVTHFVYGFNVGAFALGSKTDFSAEGGASAFGFGTGTSGEKTTKAEKKGGDLAVCQSDEATEVKGCKAPIRLTLRKLSDGESPDTVAANAKETPTANSLAGEVKLKQGKLEEAGARYNDAVRKMNAGDGKGCLSDLDKHDRLDPRPDGLSTNPKGNTAGMRAQCVMLSGKCNAGKALMRKVQVALMPNMNADAIDNMVESLVATRCKGGKRTKRDELLYAWNQLKIGAQKESGCEKSYATVKRLRPKVKAKSDRDYSITTITKAPADVIAGCYVRAKACKKAWNAYKEEEGTRLKRDYPTSKRTDTILRSKFDATHGQCKGK